MIDMTNEVNVNGLIYYPDFCKIVLRKYREENREVLNQALFKVGIPFILILKTSELRSTRLRRNSLPRLISRN